MDEKKYSKEIMDLLSRLNKGHTWGANRVLNLSETERDIFMAAADESGKIRKKEFADLMKGKNRNIGPGPLLCPIEGELHPHGCFMWMNPPILNP